MLRSLTKILLMALMTALIWTIATPASAKELANRLGIGYANNALLNIPTVETIYYPNHNVGVLGALGIDTANNNSSFVATGGARKLIFLEDNMNFFMGANLSLLSQTINNSSNSGFELAGLVGAEFFLPGLENLGFNFDTGVAVSNLNNTRFRILGDSFVNGGVIFYF